MSAENSTSLSASEERRLLTLLRRRAGRSALWTPQEGPQTVALDSLADDTFFGGAAGGGKSDWLLGTAISSHERSVIFRRHFKDLSWLEERSRQIIGDAAAFNGQLHRFKFSDNRILEFGALQHAWDWEKWQGIPHDFIGVDEVTQHIMRVVKTLVAWNRSTTPGQRCRAGYTFNPPTTADGMWVLDELKPWLDEGHARPAMPGELRWFAMIDGESVEVDSGDAFDHRGETIYPRSRTFIPATLADNKYLGDDYRRTLQSLPEPLRSQMLYGDMKAGAKDDAWQVIPSAWVREANERWRREGVPTNDKGEPLPQSGMGVDVARGGDDRTVIVTAIGHYVEPPRLIPGAETPNGQSVVRLMREHWRDESPVSIDVIGVGSSPYDIARADGVRIYGVNFAAGTKAHAKGNAKMGFMNVRAEAYWRLREALDPDGDERIALPPDAEMFVELTAPRFEQTARGIRIEEKDRIKERIGRSPDKADALALCLMSMRRSR